MPGFFARLFATSIEERGLTKPPRPPVHAKPSHPPVHFDGLYINDLGPGNRVFFRFFEDGYVLCARAGWSLNEAAEKLQKGKPLREMGLGQWSFTGDDIIHFEVQLHGQIIIHAGTILGHSFNNTMLVAIEDPKSGRVTLPMKHSFARVDPAYLGSTSPAVKWPFFREEGEFPILMIHDRPGVPTRVSCDPRFLDSSQKSIPNAPHWASYVFFSPDVLNRYYRNEGPYSIQEDSLNKGRLLLEDRERDWRGECLEINGRIRMCLGAVGDLRAAERRHWAAHNLEPRA